MFKSFSALAVFTLLGASVMALPALAPKVEASEVAFVSNADRPQADAPALNCAAQVWPEIAASCLRTTDDGPKILEVRLVTVRR